MRTYSSSSKAGVKKFLKSVLKDSGAVDVSMKTKSPAFGNLTPEQFVFKFAERQINEGWREVLGIFRRIYE